MKYYNFVYIKSYRFVFISFVKKNTLYIVNENYLVPGTLNSILLHHLGEKFEI